MIFLFVLMVEVPRASDVEFIIIAKMELYVEANQDLSVVRFVRKDDLSQCSLLLFLLQVLLLVSQCLQLRCTHDLALLLLKLRPRKVLLLSAVTFAMDVTRTFNQI
jgi:hypothetical protein